MLSVQSKLDEANKHVVEKIRKLCDAILKLQSELAVLRQMNSLLSNRLTNKERESWANAQQGMLQKGVSRRYRHSQSSG